MDQVVDLGGDLVQVVVGTRVEHQALGLVGAGVDALGTGWGQDLVRRAVNQQDRNVVREPGDGIGAVALGGEGDDGSGQWRGRTGLDDDGAAEGVAGEGDSLDALALQVGKAGEEVEDALPQHRGLAVENLERGDVLC